MRNTQLKWLVLVSALLAPALAFAQDVPIPSVELQTPSYSIPAPSVDISATSSSNGFTLTSSTDSNGTNLSLSGSPTASESSTTTNSGAWVSLRDQGYDEYPYTVFGTVTVYVYVFVGGAFDGVMASVAVNSSGLTQDPYENPFWDPGRP